MRAGRGVVASSYRMVAAGLFSMLVGGCSLWSEDASCQSDEEYQAAQVSSPVSVPAGLDRPDRSSQLNVPEGPMAAEPLSRNAACLQRPPNYFDRPVTDSDN